MDNSPFKRIAEFGKEHCPTCKPDNHKRLEELRNRHAKNEARKKYHDALVKETKTDNAYKDYKLKKDVSNTWDNLGHSLIGEAKDIRNEVVVAGAAEAGRLSSSPGLGRKLFGGVARASLPVIGAIEAIDTGINIVKDKSIGDRILDAGEAMGRYLTSRKPITGKKE